MTTPVDEEAAEAEITRLERETEGLKILTAQQDAANEARMDEVLKAAAAAPPVKTNETRRHLNELKGAGIEYPRETDYGARQSGGALFPRWLPVPMLVIGCAIQYVLLVNVAVAPGEVVPWGPGYDKPTGYLGTYQDLNSEWRSALDAYNPEWIDYYRAHSVTGWVPGDPIPTWNRLALRVNRISYLPDECIYHPDDAFELWNLSFVDNYRMFQPFMGIEFLAFVEWLKRVRRRSGERLKTFDDKMREKGRADYKAAYLNVPGAFAWINLCAAPGCRKEHAHFDHHALSRQFTGPMCNEHNTSGKRARDQFGPEHFVKMAVKAEAHLRVRGDAIAVSDRAGDDPKPIGPGGGHY